MRKIIINSPTYGTKEVLVDDSDFETANKIVWHLKKHRNTYYAIRSERENKKNIRLYLHRLLLGVTDSKIKVDHKDHNGLNCQRENMRIATHSQNQRNTSSRKNSSSKYLGVYVILRKGEAKAYGCQIKTKGKRVNIGTFPYTPEGEVAAAKAYDGMAKKHFGEFANPNFKQ